MPRKSLIVLALAVAGVLALALAARLLMVEPRGAQLLCAGADPAWWCPLRSVLVEVFQWQVFGVVSLVSGLVGWVFGGRGWGVTALLSGAAGLVLYNVALSAVGVVTGVVVVTRRTEPARHRPRSAAGGRRRHR